MQRISVLSGSFLQNIKDHERHCLYHGYWHLINPIRRAIGPCVSRTLDYEGTNQILFSFDPDNSITSKNAHCDYEDFEPRGKFSFLCSKADFARYVCPQIQFYSDSTNTISRQERRRKEREHIKNDRKTFNTALQYGEILNCESGEDMFPNRPDSIKLIRESFFKFTQNNSIQKDISKLQKSVAQTDLKQYYTINNGVNNEFCAYIDRPGLDSYSRCHQLLGFFTNNKIYNKGFLSLRECNQFYNKNGELDNLICCFSFTFQNVLHLKTISSSIGPDVENHVYIEWKNIPMLYNNLSHDLIFIGGSDRSDIVTKTGNSDDITIDGTTNIPDFQIKCARTGSCEYNYSNHICEKIKQYKFRSEGESAEAHFMLSNYLKRDCSPKSKLLTIPRSEQSVNLQEPNDKVGFMFFWPFDFNIHRPTGFCHHLFQVVNDKEPIISDTPSFREFLTEFDFYKSSSIRVSYTKKFQYLTKLKRATTVLHIKMIGLHNKSTFNSPGLITETLTDFYNRWSGVECYLGRMNTKMTKEHKLKSRKIMSKYHRKLNNLKQTKLIKNVKVDIRKQGPCLLKLSKYLSNPIYRTVKVHIRYDPRDLQNPMNHIKLFNNKIFRSKTSKLLRYKTLTINQFNRTFLKVYTFSTSQSSSTPSSNITEGNWDPSPKSSGEFDSKHWSDNIIKRVTDEEKTDGECWQLLFDIFGQGYPDLPPLQTRYPLGKTLVPMINPHIVNDNLEVSFIVDDNTKVIHISKIEMKSHIVEDSGSYKYNHFVEMLATKLDYSIGGLTLTTKNIKNGYCWQILIQYLNIQNNLNINPQHFNIQYPTRGQFTSFLNEFDLNPRFLKPMYISYETKRFFDIEIIHITRVSDIKTKTSVPLIFFQNSNLDQDAIIGGTLKNSQLAKIHPLSLMGKNQNTIIINLLAEYVFDLVATDDKQIDDWNMCFLRILNLERISTYEFLMLFESTSGLKAQHLLNLYNHLKDEKFLKSAKFTNQQIFESKLFQYTKCGGHITMDNTNQLKYNDQFIMGYLGALVDWSRRSKRPMLIGKRGEDLTLEQLQNYYNVHSRKNRKRSSTMESDSTIVMSSNNSSQESLTVSPMAKVYLKEILEAEEDLPPAPVPVTDTFDSEALKEKIMFDRAVRDSSRGIINNCASDYDEALLFDDPVYLFYVVLHAGGDQKWPYNCISRVPFTHVHPEGIVYECDDDSLDFLTNDGWVLQCKEPCKLCNVVECYHKHVCSERQPSKIKDSKKPAAIREITEDENNPGYTKNGKKIVSDEEKQREKEQNGGKGNNNTRAASTVKKPRPKNNNHNNSYHTQVGFKGSADCYCEHQAGCKDHFDELNPNFICEKHILKNGAECRCTIQGKIYSDSPDHKHKINSEENYIICPNCDKHERKTKRYVDPNDRSQFCNKCSNCAQCGAHQSHGIPFECAKLCKNCFIINQQQIGDHTDNPDDWLRESQDQWGSDDNWEYRGDYDDLINTNITGNPESLDPGETSDIMQTNEIIEPKNNIILRNDNSFSGLSKQTQMELGIKSHEGVMDLSQNHIIKTNLWHEVPEKETVPGKGNCSCCNCKSCNGRKDFKYSNKMHNKLHVCIDSYSDSSSNSSYSSSSSSVVSELSSMVLFNKQGKCYQKLTKSAYADSDVFYTINNNRNHVSLTNDEFNIDEEVHNLTFKNLQKFLKSNPDIIFNGLTSIKRPSPAYIFEDHVGWGRFNFYSPISTSNSYQIGSISLEALEELNKQNTIIRLENNRIHINHVILDSPAPLGLINTHIMYAMINYNNNVGAVTLDNELSIVTNYFKALSSTSLSPNSPTTPIPMSLDIPTLTSALHNHIGDPAVIHELEHLGFTFDSDDVSLAGRGFFNAVFNIYPEQIPSSIQSPSINIHRLNQVVQINSGVTPNISFYKNNLIDLSILGRSVTIDWPLLIQCCEKFLTESIYPQLILSSNFITPPSQSTFDNTVNLLKNSCSQDYRRRVLLELNKPFNGSTINHEQFVAALREQPNPTNQSQNTQQAIIQTNAYNNQLNYPVGSATGIVRNYTEGKWGANEYGGQGICFQQLYNNPQITTFSRLFIRYDPLNKRNSHNHISTSYPQSMSNTIIIESSWCTAVDFAGSGYIFYSPLSNVSNTFEPETLTITNEVNASKDNSLLDSSTRTKQLTIEFAGNNVASTLDFSVYTNQGDCYNRLIPRLNSLSTNYGCDHKIYVKIHKENYSDHNNHISFEPIPEHSNYLVKQVYLQTLEQFIIHGVIFNAPLPFNIEQHGSFDLVPDIDQYIGRWEFHGTVTLTLQNCLDVPDNLESITGFGKMTVAQMTTQAELLNWYPAEFLEFCFINLKPIIRRITTTIGTPLQTPVTIPSYCFYHAHKGLQALLLLKSLIHTPLLQFPSRDRAILISLGVLTSGRNNFYLSIARDHGIRTNLPVMADHLANIHSDPANPDNHDRHLDNCPGQALFKWNSAQRQDILDPNNGFLLCADCGDIVGYNASGPHNGTGIPSSCRNGHQIVTGDHLWSSRHILIRRGAQWTANKDRVHAPQQKNFAFKSAYAPENTQDPNWWAWSRQCNHLNDIVPTDHNNPISDIRKPIRLPDQWEPQLYTDYQIVDRDFQKRFTFQVIRKD